MWQFGVYIGRRSPPPSFVHQGAMAGPLVFDQLSFERLDADTAANSTYLDVKQSPGLPFMLEVIKAYEKYDKDCQRLGL